MPIDYPKLFNIVDKITTLPIIRKGNNWYGKCYINGKPAHRFDKTVITLLPKNIRILENGGEVMSIAKWLVSYGGCKNYSEAYKKLRNEESGVINTTFVIEEEKPIRYISQEILNQASTQTDNLFIFLSELFNNVKEAYQKYNITSINEHTTCFWYINKEGNICHENCITYLSNGHRDKNLRAFRRFKISNGYRGKCYFGEHLLKEKNYKKVYLLEGEKSALIMSLMFPKHLFLATGGMNNLREVEKDWILLPDHDAYNYWHSRYPKQVVKWWESFPDYEVGEKDDIVDYYLKKIEK